MATFVFQGHCWRTMSFVTSAACEDVTMQNAECRMQNAGMSRFMVGSLGLKGFKG
jgi:hypothetical protein